MSSGHAAPMLYTHVCVCPLSDGEEGVKRFCNQPLKLFRASKALGAAWSTTASVAHSKKKHVDSKVARQQKGRAEKRQMRMGDCMHASGSAGIESSSSKHFTYALSENEKVLSAVDRWGLYAKMKVSQAAFEDPLFVASDLHVRLKAEEIRMLVMLRMNREFMEYMRSTFPDTPLSEFKTTDTYVRGRGGLESFDDDEEDA
jgi:hypothetical protein